MSSGRWWRDNLFLVAGITLPLAVVGFFLLATTLARVGVPPPQHDLLLTAAHYRNSERAYRVDFEVRDGRAVAVLRASNENHSCYSSCPDLYRFDHETLQLEPVAIEYPGQLEPGEAERVIDTGVDGRVLTTQSAPDGYRLRDLDGRGSNLFQELFGGGRRSRYAIARDGRVISIPMPADTYYYQLDFLGWIADERD